MRASSATKDVTPVVAVDQGCGFPREEVDAGVTEDRLEINFLALWTDSEGDPLLIVTLDLLYPGQTIRDIVEVASGLAAERILVAASHTHAAPMTDFSKPKLGRPDALYMDSLTEALHDGVREVLDPAGAVEVTLSVGCGMGDNSVNRRRSQRFHLGRRSRGRHIALAPNHRGSRDETLILGEITSLGGQVLAYIWNYACHPVGHPTPKRNSAHFPGVVRTALRDGALIPVLFLQGFSGDTRPNAAVRRTSLAKTLMNAGVWQGFSAMTSSAYLQWTSSLAGRVIDLKRQMHRVEYTTVGSSRVSVEGSRFTAGQITPVVFQAWTFGSALTIVGVSAEPVSAYAPFVRRLAPGSVTMCVGCIDDVYGYLPTAKVVEEGGYEGREFCASFELGVPMPDIEQAAVEGFKAVLETTPAESPRV